MIYRITSHLPRTRIKLFGARILFVTLRLFIRSNHVQVIRKGIHYHLDLSEGIDLSVFLFGGFQKQVVNSPHYSAPRDAVVFDVGANMGCMTLAFARYATRGRIHAFEPTDETFGKLLKNISLNPDLKVRIVPVKCFVSDRSLSNPALKAVASWRTDRFFSGGHPLSGGRTLPTGNAPCTTLDDYCRDKAIHRLDLIKIDTEGQELAVIKGAMSCIGRFKPVIIFEAGQYLFDEHGIRFTDFIELLGGLGYRFQDLRNGKVIDQDNFPSIIPRRSTIDILARV